MEKKLTADEIQALLEGLGETGTAKVRGGGLYSRREENCDERFHGAVDEDAAEIVREFFARPQEGGGDEGGGDEDEQDEQDEQCCHCTCCEHDECPCDSCESCDSCCSHEIGRPLPACCETEETGETSDVVHCQCGWWDGDSCNWTGPRNSTVLVEFMPDEHRASHDAAGNAGVYPHNGAMRVRVERECARRMVAIDPEWVEVLEVLDS